MTVTALVIAIISIVTALVVWMPCLGWVSWFAWIVPVVGFIFGIVGRSNDAQQARPTGMATAAIVMSVIAFLILAVRGFISIFTLGI